MAIVKLKRSQSAFEIVPRATLQDTRLSLDALGALVRLVSLPGNWEWHTWHLEKEVLQVGRDYRRRIFDELEKAGYLNRSRKNDESGRWHHEYSLHISSTRAAPTSDGLAVGGEPTAGKGGDIENTKSEKTDLKNTQQQPAAQVSSCCYLIFDKAIDCDLHAQLRRLLSDVEKLLAQQMLDTVAQKIIWGRSGEAPIVGSELGLIKSFIKNPADFDPSPGKKIAAARLNKKAVDDSNRQAAKSPFLKDAIAAAKGEDIFNKIRRKKID